MSLTLVSLFAGVGGFDLGFERAGFTTVGQCEIDPHATSVLNKHWPDTPKHDDVTTLTGMHFGPAEVVTFGSPCQDLSVAGKRAGLDGERSGLFLEAVRFIREMLEATNGGYPRWAVWENVPGAFSSADGADFAAVLSLLVGGEVRRPTGGWAYAGVAFGPLGAAEWRVLDSQHFGVAQRRRRVFVVYHPGGQRAGQVLLEPKSVRGDTPQGRQAGEGVTGILEARTGGGGFPGTDFALAGGLQPVPVWKRWGGFGWGEHTDGVTPTLEAGGSTQAMLMVPAALKGRGGKEGGGKGYLGSEDQALTLDTTQSQYLAEPVAFVASEYSTGAYAPADKAGALTTSADRTRAAPIAFDLRQITSAQNRSRAEPGLPAGTPAASSEHHVATPHTVRRLMPIETERLQAFPDDWTRYAADGIEIADTHRYRMMGNAVTVSVAEWIAHRLKETP